MSNIKTLAFAAALLLLGCAEDFQRDNPTDYVNKKKSIWTTFSDADENGGSSTVTVTDNPSGSITVSGELVMEKEIDPVFAGWGTRNEEIAEKLKEATYISFGIKGGDETHRYKVQLIQSDINDYNYYYTMFITAKNMKAVTLCIDDFKQADWGAKKSLDMSKVIGIEFLAQTDYKGIGNNVPFSVIVNGLDFGTGNCVSTNEEPEQPPPITVDDWTYIAEAYGNGMIVSSIDIKNNGNAYIITGYMGDGDGGFKAIPDNIQELRTAKSVTFKVKGDPKKYAFDIPDISSQHGKIFSASSEYQTITICFSKDLTAWGGTKPVDMSSVSYMRWYIVGESQNKGPFSYTVSDISLGYEECATGGN